MSELDDQSEEVRGGKRGSTTGGARIDIRDSRVSTLLNWFWGAIGTGAVAGVWLVGSNLYQLNLSVNSMIANNAAMASQLRDHEERLRAVERSTQSLEGRTLRGGPEPVKPL